MANFFTDTPQFKHYLDHPLMKRIVELRERNYIDKILRLCSARFRRCVG